MGSPLSLLFWPNVQHWPTPPIPDAYRFVQRCDVETLLISGNLDFSTPSEYAAQELLPYLSKGQQLTRAEMGHTSDLWGIQPEAMNRLMVQFYKTGKVDGSRFTVPPMKFDAGWLSLPRIAKVLTGVIALGGAGLVTIGLMRNLHRLNRP
jgi:hypothetical protein